MPRYVMVSNSIKGILVGCDDCACDFRPENESGGYCWVIEKKDWDNGSDIVTKKIDEYKNVKEFHIYFYVYKDKNTKKCPSADDSDIFGNKIFGFADVVNIEKKKFDNEYKHHVKIKNLRLFTPKIRYEDFQNRLELWKYGKKNFGLILRSHGLLLTENDCELLRLFKFITEEEYHKRMINLMEKYRHWVKEHKRNSSSVNDYHEALEVLIIKSIEIWNIIGDKISVELLEFYRNELENDLKNIIIDFPNVLEDEKFIEAKSEINQTLDMVNKTLEKLGM